MIVPVPFVHDNCFIIALLYSIADVFAIFALFWLIYKNKKNS